MSNHVAEAVERVREGWEAPLRARIADLEAALRQIADTPVTNGDYVLISLISVARNALHNSRLSS